MSRPDNERDHDGQGRREECLAHAPFCGLGQLPRIGGANTRAIAMSAKWKTCAREWEGVLVYFDLVGRNAPELLFCRQIGYCKRREINF